MNLTIEEKLQRYKEIINKYKQVQGFVLFLHQRGETAFEEYLRSMLPILFREHIPEKVLYEIVNLLK